MNKLLLGISGKISSGKTTVASFIKTNYPNVEVLGFADGVKQEVAEACKVSIDYIEANKKLFRPMLQWWGTNFRREMRGGESYWINKTLIQIHNAFTKGTTIIVVHDVRFLNEVSAIKSSGGKMWRVERVPALRPIDDIHNHRSEIELDEQPPDFWDCVIKNDDTLFSLNNKTKLEIDKLLCTSQKSQ
jgi:dephospho-CoA kinase